MVKAFHYVATSKALTDGKQRRHRTKYIQITLAKLAHMVVEILPAPWAVALVS